MIKDIFLACFPNAKPGYADEVEKQLGNKDVLIIAAFLAQTGYESSYFTVFEENLNYSASGLLKTFPKYFNSSNAEEYARKPEKIANKVYANRLGNSDEASGDGYRYRGRGPIQITGKYNYSQCAGALSIDCVNNPDILLEPEYGVMSSKWFWDSNNLDQYALLGDLKTITKKINGGLNGYTDRYELYNKILINITKI